MSLRRIVTSGATLLPARLTVVDDGGGEVSREISQLDMIVNNDDDNLNGLVDLTESPMPRSELEDDMRLVTYSSLLTPDIPRDRGVFELVFNPAVVKVWDSKAKENQIYPTNDDYFGVYFSPSELRDFWVEGLGVGSTEFVLRWQAYSQDVPGVGACDLRYLQGNLLTIRVSGIDLDIDSDNNNGFEPPPGTEWEEFLEDNKYGLGKLVMQNYNDPDAAEHYTPLRLRVGTGIQFPETMSIRFDYESTSDAGHIILWTRDKNDPARSQADEIGPGTIIALSDLGYNSATGELTTIFISGVTENAAIKQLKGVEDNDKPEEYITTTLVSNGADIIADKVKYIVTQSDSFFYRFQFQEEIRNGIAASRIYSRADSADFCQQLLNREQLMKLGLNPAIPGHANVIQDLLEDAPSGFKAGLYRDYVSGKYVATFAGTEWPPGSEHFKDFIADLITGGTGVPEAQFASAISIGHYLSSLPSLGGGNLMATGHSLGGGLATVAVAAGGGNITADTFDSMGIRDATLAFVNAMFPSTYASPDDLIDAYYVDWDILSYLQDNLGITTWPMGQLFDPMASARGRRHEMDGPFDSRITTGQLVAILELFLGDPWVPIRTKIANMWSYAGVNTMVMSHNRGVYMYGMLVKENWRGIVIEDLLGYSIADLEGGRGP